MSAHSNHRWWRVASVLLVLGALVATTSVARAQSATAKKKALALYKEGTTQYDLGMWDQAIKFYKRSYESYPAPVLLLDIGQAYRQKGDCKSAVFFYKRYLSRAPNATNRSEVQGFIRELEENCKRTEQAKDKPPTSTLPPNKGDTASSGQHGDTNPAAGNAAAGHITTGAGTSGMQATRSGGSGTSGDDHEGSGGGMGDTGASATVSATATRPGLLVATAGIGPSFLMLGSQHQIPVRFTVRLGAGYPFVFGKILLDVGVAGTLTPVPFQGTMGANHTALITSVLANADAHYPILDKVSVRGELGVGVQWFSGVDGADSVFTDPTYQVSGPFTMPNVRVAAGVEYDVTPQLLLSAMPIVFSYSPAEQGMRSDIQRVAQYQVMVGVAYHL